MWSLKVNNIDFLCFSANHSYTCISYIYIYCFSVELPFPLVTHVCFFMCFSLFPWNNMHLIKVPFNFSFLKQHQLIQFNVQFWEYTVIDCHMCAFKAINI